MVPEERRHEMLETTSGNNDSLWCAGASAREHDVEWVVRPERVWSHGATTFRNFCRLLRRKDQRRLGNRQDVLNAFVRKRGINRVIRPPRLHRAQKSDQHF